MPRLRVRTSPPEPGDRRGCLLEVGGALGRLRRVRAQGSGLGCRGRRMRRVGALLLAILVFGACEPGPRTTSTTTTTRRARRPRHGRPPRRPARRRRPPSRPPRRRRPRRPRPRTAPPPGPCPTFPANNPWNTDITGYPVHTARPRGWRASAAATKLHPDFGTFWDGGPIGIPYVHVGAGQPKVPVTLRLRRRERPRPVPDPAERADRGRRRTATATATCSWSTTPRASSTSSSPRTRSGGGTSWHAGSGAVFDLRSNALRPDGWTSADAAGLPIFPGLVRYDEVVQEGVIDHALRFTVSRTQRGYIHPATH